MPLHSTRARVPTYRLHKPSGLGVVRLDGRDLYLGKHGTPESLAEHRRVIAEWLASPRGVPGESPGTLSQATTVDELVCGYLRFAKGYYAKHGRPTGEYQNIKDALRPLSALYGRTELSTFGPVALKTVRQSMIEPDLSRRV